MSSTTENWYQFVIADPNLLSGASVQSFLIPIIERLDISWVLTSDVEGAVSVLHLKTLSDRPIPALAFIDLVGQAAQYDWAFFFLYSNGSFLVQTGEKK